MPISLNDGGVWKAAGSAHVNQGGVWKQASQVFLKVAGVWEPQLSSEVRFINTADRTAASIFALMGSPTSPGQFVFENQATISAGTSTYALRTGVFPAGSTLTIVNKGYIRGRGGAGSGNPGSSGGAGMPGGAALHMDMACTLDNSGGYIFGGGGGGGVGLCVEPVQPGQPGLVAHCSGGGGGAGSSGGAGGVPTHSLKSNGAGGTVSAGGAGGTYTRMTRSTGGAGGAHGVAGGKGGATSTHASCVRGPGGAAGSAITRNGFVLTILAGDTTDRIKGAKA